MKQRQIRKLNNKGAAMMLTVVLIMVIMIFAFSLILVSYTLYSSQTKNLSGARNMEAVNSLSVALQDELEDEDAATNSNLWKYLRCNIVYDDSSAAWADWPYYAEDANGIEVSGHTTTEACRYFTLDKNTEIEGFPARISVCMHWEIPEDMTEAEFKSHLVSDAVAGKTGLRLVLEITAESGSQIYRVTDTYLLSVTETDDTAEQTAITLAAQDPDSNPAGHTISANEKWTWTRTDHR